MLRSDWVQSLLSAVWQKAEIPVDYLFPTLRDSPHQTKMEVSVAAMQKSLKEAFAVARHLTSEEAAKQCHYYDCKAGAVALQPGDVVMVCTNGFVGKQKVKDRWEDGRFHHRVSVGGLAHL